ncbi:MAG: putative ABC exporter domain-containing protein [Planctomycetota bacterium]
MNPALRFLVLQSFRNGAKRKIARLKNPRYLIPFLVAIAYFVAVFGGQFFFNGDERPARDFGRSFAASTTIEWGVTAMLLLQVAITWAIPSTKSGIVFKESEVDFLFGAPITRRELLTFKILATQPALILMTMFFGFFAGFSAGLFRGVMIFVAGWLTFNLLTLHQMGARFMQTSLFRHGKAGWKRNAPALLVIAGLVALVVFSAPALPEFNREITKTGPQWLAELGESPAGWALMPLRAVARLALAPDFVTFATWLPVVMFMVGVLHAWVIRTDAFFEEAAAEQAKEMARVVSAAREGRLGSLRSKPKESARSAPWKLASVGPPEGAFLWKTVTGLARSISPLFLGLLPLLVAGLVAVDFMASERTGKDLPIASGVLFGLTVMLMMAVMMGQMVPGMGFRGALRHVDILKVLPLHPPRLVRCHVFATLVPLALAEILLAVLAVALCPDLPKKDFTLAWRLSVIGSAAIVLPAITAISLTLDAALAILFPGWLRPVDTHQPAGMETMGQNMLIMLGKMVGVGVAAVIPGLLVAAIVALGISFGPTAALPGVILLAAAGAGATLAGEIHLVTNWLGRRFENLDPAEEEMLA